MKTLYELGFEELKLAEALEQCEGGDLSKVEGLEAFLDQHAADVGEKLEGYVRLIRQLELEASGAKAEKEQWAAKEKSLAGRADFLKTRLKEFLERTGQSKLQTATGRVIALQACGGTAPLEIDEAVPLDEVSPLFVKVVKTIDRNAVRDYLEAKGTLPFARLLPRGTSLRIK